jgi:hypothetical protein
MLVTQLFQGYCGSDEHRYFLLWCSTLDIYAKAGALSIWRGNVMHSPTASCGHAIA